MLERHNDVNKLIVRLILKAIHALGRVLADDHERILRINGGRLVLELLVKVLHFVNICGARVVHGETFCGLLAVGDLNFILQLDLALLLHLAVDVVVANVLHFVHLLEEALYTGVFLTLLFLLFFYLGKIEIHRTLKDLNWVFLE